MDTYRLRFGRSVLLRPKLVDWPAIWGVNWIGRQDKVNFVSDNPDSATACGDGYADGQKWGGKSGIGIRFTRVTAQPYSSDGVFARPVSWPVHA